MSRAIRIYQGRFGRVALLEMDKPLIAHAHHHCHVLIKISGPDTFFSVRGRPQPLTGDTAVLVNAWESHAYAYHAAEAGDTMLMAMYIEPSWLGMMQRALAVSGHPNFFPAPCVSLCADARRLSTELALQMLATDSFEANRLESQLFDLLMPIIDRNSEWRNFGRLLRASRGHVLDPRIRRATALIRENLGDALDFETVASRCGLSRAHFFAMFRRCTQLTPAVYANVLRMEAAIRSLSRSNDAMASISLDLGFSAQSHFTRFFREHLGITPTDYRSTVDVLQSSLDVATMR